MALRLIEGFESFGANGTTGSTLENAIKAKYAEANTDYSSPDCEIAGGWGIGLGLQSGYSASAVYNYINFTFDNQDTWTIGFAYRTPDSYSGRALFRFRELDEDVQLWLGVSSSGKIYIANSNESWYGSRVLKPNTWYYIEFKVYIDNASGTIDVNINGTADLVQTGIDTDYYGSGYVGQVQLNLTSDEGFIIDDLYIADGASSFIGPCKIETIRPNGDDTVAWDCSNGSDHYALINEVGPNASDYVEGDTLDESDLYTYSNLTNITNNISGVQLNTAGGLDVAGSRLLIDRIDSNGTDSNGSGVALSDTNYEVVYRILENDPDTNSSWSVNAIDAIKAGVIVGD